MKLASGSLKLKPQLAEKGSDDTAMSSRWDQPVMPIYAEKDGNVNSEHNKREGYFEDEELDMQVDGERTSDRCRMESSSGHRKSKNQEKMVQSPKNRISKSEREMSLSSGDVP